MRTDDAGIIQQQLDRIIELLEQLVEQTSRSKGAIPYGPFIAPTEIESSVTEQWNPETAAEAWRKWQAEKSAERSQPKPPRV